MSHFEFLTVAFSILIAMAIARLLEGLVHQARTTSGYWIHTCWIVLVLVNALTLWWMLWELNANEWTLVTFLTLLAGPALLFAQAALLVPLDPTTINDWRTFYYDNTRAFFLVRAISSVQAIIAGNMLTEVLPDRALIIGPITIAILLGAAFTKNARYHAAVVLLSVAGAVAALVSIA